MPKHTDTKIASKHIAIISVVLIFTTVGSFALGRMINADKNLRQNAPEQIMSQNISSTPNSIIPNSWLNYEFKGFKNNWEGWIWKPFILKFPPMWSITEEILDDATQTFRLTLTKKDGGNFTIIQGFAEGGRCIYPNDPSYTSFDGMGATFAAFDEIKKQDYTWRLSAVKDPDPQLDTHLLCSPNSKNPTDYIFGADVIGFAKIQLFNDESYKEFLDILNQIEIK